LYIDDGMDEEGELPLSPADKTIGEPPARSPHRRVGGLREG
jgi:hypothetical protein